MQWENVEAWEKVGQASSTPELASIVQEIVHEPTWKSGDALAFFISGVGQRVAASCDLQPAAAPRLQIVYQLPPQEEKPVQTELPIDLDDQSAKVFLPLTAVSGCR